MHSVPVADGHLAVVNGVEVDGHAVGCANLILTAVAAADALSVVVLGPEVFAQQVVDTPGGGQQFFVPAQRQRGYSYGGQVPVDVGNDAHVVSVGLLVIGVQPEGQYGAVNACRGLDDVGIVAAVLCFGP